MNVRVRTIGIVQTLLGRADVGVQLPEGATIDALFDALAALGGERLAPYVAVPERQDALLCLRVMVNGRDITGTGGRRTALAEGDEVFVFMPLAGG